MCMVLWLISTRTQPQNTCTVVPIWGVECFNLYVDAFVKCLIFIVYRKHILPLESTVVSGMWDWIQNKITSLWHTEGFIFMCFWKITFVNNITGGFLNEDVLLEVRMLVLSALKSVWRTCWNKSVCPFCRYVKTRPELQNVSTLILLTIFKKIYVEFSFFPVNLCKDLCQWIYVHFYSATC